MQIISRTEESRTKPPEIVVGEHLLGRFSGSDNGATLIVLGGIHGNEASGVRAMWRVLLKLRELESKLKGRVFLLAGNTRALCQGVRFIDADLNRHWTMENVKRNHPTSKILIKRAEDLEQKELLEIFEEILTTAKNEVYAIDLHSTSAVGMPFATVGDTLRNRAFAQKFPVTILLGIEEQLEGTLLEFLNNLGVVTLGYEAGQHDAESTTDNQEALIWLGLINAGILSKEDFPEYEKYLRRLQEAVGRPRIVEVRYRHAITEEDNFRMEPGFANFQPVRRGELLAKDRKGSVYAKESGLILMPLYQKLGEDGFFLGREVAPFWLWLSKILRRLRISNLVPLLPGVKRSAYDSDVLEINTRIARFFPLQVFHLLGFRKLRWRNDQLVVTRRKFDTKSPFLRNETVG